MRRTLSALTGLFVAGLLSAGMASTTPAIAVPLPPGQNPGPGATLVNPIIDCNANPVGATGNVVGIIIDDSNTTVINPSIRECDQGIRVTKKNGVMPTNVRIIASAASPGYAATNFTLNRAAIEWRAGNGEIGDVSAPADQVGGEMQFTNDFRYLAGNLTTGLRIHHTSSTCTIPCPTFSGADSPGAHWGLKFIADRTLGAPYEASHIRFDHNFVQGFDDEGISFDPRGGDGAVALSLGAGSVTAKSATQDTLTISNIPSGGVGMFVRVNEGAAKGASLKITARRSNVFTVNDPTNVIGSVAVGDRVTVGGRFFDNRIDHNTIDAFHHTAAKSGFNTAHLLYSRIADNLIYDTPSFNYQPSFHLRTNHQCIMVRSLAGPAGIPNFSFFNSVVGNTCRDSGDISAVIVSWGTYEVDSPTWISGNTFTGSPLGQVHRYKASQPASDPT
jgi:hypothetical protein